MVVLALVTGLSVVFLYRHYNANLNVLDVSSAARTNRPAHEGADRVRQGPLNILVMGSDNRDAPGDHIDNLTGIGKRSDTTILLHLSADRKHAYGVSIPRDSLVNRPACYDDNGKQIPGAHRRDVERRLQRRRPGLHDRSSSSSSPTSRSTTSSSSTSPASSGMVDAIGGVQRLHPARRRRPASATSPCRPAPTSSSGTRPSTTCASGTSSATAPTSAG